MEYHIYKDKAGLFRWRLLAANQKIIAESGESYHNKSDCQAGISLVKSSSNAPIYDR